MNNKLKILLFCLSVVMFVGCDRITKDSAKEHLMNRLPVSYFHNTIQLMYVENTGAAMSLGDHLPKAVSFWLLSIVPLLFLVFLSAYVIRHTRQMRFAKTISFALIISGGIGNIIDRIAFDRHVTDFIFLEYKSLHTGIFNIADVCVSAGVIGLLIFYKDKKQAVLIPDQTIHT